MDREKLYNILICDDVVGAINDNLEYILRIILELKDMIGFEHRHPHYHLDVWNHTLLALSYSLKDFDIRLVLLLHDIRKPHCYQDGEIRHFRGHPKTSAKISFNILKRLKFNDDEIFKLYYLIERHDMLITNEEITNNVELAILRFKVQCCDALAHNPLKLDKRIKYLMNIEEKINNKKRDCNCKKLILNTLNKL